MKYAASTHEGCDWVATTMPTIKMTAKMTAEVRVSLRSLNVR